MTLSWDCFPRPVAPSARIPRLRCTRAIGAATAASPKHLRSGVATAAGPPTTSCAAQRCSAELVAALRRPANRPYWRYDHAMPGSKTVREGRTSRELMNDALHAEDEDVRSNIIGELQRRGTREELELMAALFEGGEQEQVLACEVLGQLGFTRRELGAYPFGVETAALVQRGLRSAS